MGWGADCTGGLVLLGASFPLTAADGREFTVFYMADRRQCHVLVWLLGYSDYSQLAL